MRVPWLIKYLNIIVLFGGMLSLAMPAASAQVGCEGASLRIYGGDGTPISGATVTISGMGLMISDWNGKVTLRCQGEFYFPLQAEISAKGYQSLTTVLRNHAVSNDIYLEPEQAASVRTMDTGTVNASELQRGVQERSRELQEQASVELNNEHYEEAERLFREAMELTPSSAGIYNNIGVTYLRRHEVDAAAPWFEKAVELAPYNPQAAGNLGLLRWMQGLHDEGFRLLERAVQNGFENPTAHYLLGILYLQKVRFNEAVNQLRRANPERLPYRDLYLSIAYARAGDERAAAKSYREFVKKHPASFLAAQLQ